MVDSLETHEAEQALVGILLHDNSKAQTIRDSLRQEHFSNHVLGEIYHIIIEDISKRQAVDAITVYKKTSHLFNDLNLDGAEYLAEIVECTPVGAAIVEYSKMIIDVSVRRSMLSLYERGSVDVVDNFNDDAHAVLDEHLSELVRIQRQGTGQSKFATTQDAVSALFNPERPAVINTGFDTIDKIAKLPRGGITLLGGRASMGKSALFIELAFNAARRGLRVDLFSMEMNRQQIAARAISSALARDADARNGFPDSIAYRDIYEGSVGNHMDAVKDAARRLPTLNFDDTPRLTVSDIKARCAANTEPLDLIFIDYLNIMSLDDCGSVQRHDQKLGLAASKLRDFAKDTGAAVVLLCQLNRGSLQRDNAVPQLHDLRDSGELEQHADTVLFVHREHYYKQRELEAKEAAGERVSNEEVSEVRNIENYFDVIVAKQRMGEIGKALMYADMKYNYIKDR